MPNGLKELVVVLVLAGVVFRLARPIALKFSSAADFSRRRTVWLALTATAFLSPDFWLFALVAVPLLLWGQRRDTNPVAFYLALLQVIPRINIDIPMIGINELFSIDIFRLLSLCVLVPTAWRYRRAKEGVQEPSAFGVPDLLLIGYGVLTTILYVPPDLPNHLILPDSPTNLLRRGFLYFIDVYVLYYVVSRTCATRAAITEALAAFCLSSALLAPVAVFETLRGWLLYVDIVVRWSGEAAFGFYALRGSTLRAVASTGGSLVLGYVLAIALGFWLYLGARAASVWTRVAVACLYVFGLLAAFSRGPWVGAIAIYLAFVALGPRAVPRLFKAAAVMAIAMGALLASPLGERIISVLPFMGGSVDSSTIQYRQRLAARSWELIEQRPWFGDQLAYQKMEDLRQGMGIIDLVNTYASIALFYGGVGLFLFLTFILLALARAYRVARRTMRSDPDLSVLGVSLVACIIGTLVMIAACSFIDQYAIMFYVLGGLAVSYARLQQAAEPGVVAGEVRAPAGGSAELR